MAQNRSRNDLIRFLDYLGEKGLIAKATASARRTAAEKVLAALSDDEAQDVLLIDLDHLMTRFDNLNPHRYTPDSLQTYRSRLKSALEDFRAYSDNPVTFRPNGKIKARRAASDGSGAAKKSASTPPQVIAPPSPPPPMVDLPSLHQLPIQLRQDLTVRIFGLPFDLTKQEAQKIANIILAHTMDA